jgi:hypothetical protein
VELLAGLGLWLVFLFAIGLPRALERHLHVDEVQLAYETVLAMVHHRPDLAQQTTTTLVVAGWVVSSFSTTAAMFAGFRLVFFALFVTSLAACAWAQPFFTTTRGRLAVLYAATFCHSLWMYGFEIRMDVLTGLGSVILFGLTQRARDRDASWRVFFCAGLVSATMQMHSLKATAYWLSFSGALLTIGTWRAVSRTRPALLFGGGLVAGVMVNLAVIVIGGQTNLFVRGWTSTSGMATTATRFSPTPELLRTVTESPVLFGLAAVQIVFAIRRRTPASLITTGFLAWSLVLLYLNPQPFPYNLQLVTPFALFAAIDVIARLLEWHPQKGAYAAAGLAVASVALFARAWITNPYLTRTNGAQLSYARAAEALTRSDQTVLDGAGLVLSRLPPDKDWFVHSLRMAAYRDGLVKHFADIMIEHPSPVIVDNYRWGWLSPLDLQTRANRYLRVAPRLFVLGSRLGDAGEGDIPIYCAGRYRIIGPVRIDDAKDGELGAGLHHWVRTGEGAAAIRWVGADEQASVEAVEAIQSLGKGEPMFTNTPTEVPR